MQIQKGSIVLLAILTSVKCFGYHNPKNSNRQNLAAGFYCEETGIWERGYEKFLLRFRDTGEYVMNGDKPLHTFDFSIAECNNHHLRMGWLRKE